MRFLAILGIGAAASSPAVGQGTRGAAQIDVVGNDYAFMPLPARISAGPTIFSFENHGKVPHEMSVARLKAGLTIVDMLKVSKEGGRIRDLIERSVGILIAGPGKSPDGRLLVDLVRGETYIMFCIFRDTPEAATHLMLGMYTSFRPQ